MTYGNISCSEGAGAQENDAEQVEVSVRSLEFDGDGGTVAFTVTANSPWKITGPDWVSITPSSGKGDGSQEKVTATAEKNEKVSRAGTITIALQGGKVHTLAATQPKGTVQPTPPEPEDGNSTFVFCANSMVYYGGCVQYGNQGKEDPGMFCKLLKANGYNECKVIDCTYGGHHLYDYATSGCQTSGGGCPGKGTDLIKNVVSASVDYVICSESGNNNSNFYTDVTAIYDRFRAANPNVKLVYINHVYSVYKKHGNILDNLKKLHDEYGVTIINCGQLAYDIYTGAVKVPNGTLTYKDRYTFCNHTDSDTYHPNPLMGYIMTQMLYCAITGGSATYPDYLSLVKSCEFGKNVAYSSYYSKFYTTAAALPFTDVLENAGEIAGIQQLIPQYIDKY